MFIGGLVCEKLLFDPCCVDVWCMCCGAVRVELVRGLPADQQSQKGPNCQ